MDKLERLFREADSVQRQIDATSQRIHNRKGMNGYQWDDRASCVEASKNISKLIESEVRARAKGD